jgi:MFS family permease
MKEETGFKVYGYRWIMLLAFMLVVVINQFMWITFASVTGDAAQFYKVSDLAIGLLSVSFMVVYIFISIPASWVIDKYGIKVAVGIGAVLTGIFGLLRGLVPSSYALVLVSQIGIAIGQPFILNAITKVAARWFPVRERATAAGLGTLAMYFGILMGLLITPFITLHTGFGRMLLVYGIFSAICSMVFFLIARERPPTPPCPPEEEERSLMFEGMKQILRQREFIRLMIIFFIGLGVFNAVTTWIEDIVRPRGFTAIQAGISGSLMIAGGVVGALILPLLSDRYRKRVPFIILALGGAILGLTGITFANPYWLLILSAFVLGFFLLSAGPIGFQYGAEITYPAPEGTSNGLLLLMGQISGIIFIVTMDILKSPYNGSMTMPLIGLIIFMGIGLALSFNLKESLLIKKEETG